MRGMGEFGYQSDHTNVPRGVHFSGQKVEI